jgi:2-polyprenyl-3-methyl-5-hydroxy-6-metoxy-1,4-benzoquinol methylase
MSEPSPVSSARSDALNLSRGDPEWWEERYASGDIPWDTGVTPPEVVQLIESGVVGKGWALDLGCGSGVTSRFLATNGFRVIGLDLSHLALRRGAAQAASAGLACSFVRASVAHLCFLRVRTNLAIDVGCFHSLPSPERPSYVRSLAEHVLPGGHYLLYTFIAAAYSEPGGEATGPRLALSDIAAFAPWFALRSARHGDDRGRSSAWFLFQRTSVK